jgi:hypothetical protein
VISVATHLWPAYVRVRRLSAGIKLVHETYTSHGKWLPAKTVRTISCRVMVGAGADPTNE